MANKSILDAFKVMWQSVVDNFATKKEVYDSFNNLVAPPIVTLQGDKLAISAPTSDDKLKQYKIVINRVEGNSLIQEKSEYISSDITEFDLWNCVYNTACQDEQDPVGTLLAIRHVEVYCVYDGKTEESNIVSSAPSVVTYKVKTYSHSFDWEYEDQFEYIAPYGPGIKVSFNGTALKEDDIFWTGHEIEEDGDDILNDSSLSITQSKNSYDDTYRTTITILTNNYWTGDCYFDFSYIGIAKEGDYNVHQYCTERANFFTLETCLVEGTQILMADGSYKNIEDVCGGDMIKSWDIKKKQYIDVRCLARIRTGRHTNYTVYTFDNDESLTIYGSHGIFTVDAGGVRDAVNWKIGDKGVSVTGEEVALVGIEDRTFKDSKKRYTLISENNVYFANNILCAHSAKRTYDAYKAGKLIAELSEEDKERIERQYESLRYYTEWRTDKTFKTETKEIQSVYDSALANIADAKNQLSERDYKAVKYLQNKLTEEEWAENIVICEELRKVINDNEETMNSALEQLADARERLGFARSPKSKANMFRRIHAENNKLIRARANN